MAIQWLRRAVLLAASASALLLAACGGGSIDSQFSPERLVVFGDASADLGQTGSRYTVNDGSPIWTQYVASEFELALQPSSAGGTSYATGNARVVAKPDAAGNAATPTVKEQIDSFLAGSSASTNDLFIVSAGTSDVIAEVQAQLSAGQTEAQTLANLEAAATAMADQVRRLIAAGATHIAVLGTYNLGRSPWAIQIGQTSLLESASRRFNQTLLVSMVDLGATVLYVDEEFQFNLHTSQPSTYSLDNVTDPVCTSVDPGPGIGTGTGQVNSRLCSPATVRSADYNRFLFADRVYPTPRGHELLGDYAKTRIRDRW